MTDLISVSDANGVRTLRFKTNQLLNRKQFVVVVDHPNWNGTVPVKKVKEQLAKLYKVADEQQVAVFAMKTQFGGGQTRGFAVIYDDVAAMKRIEPNYRLQRIGLGRKRMVSRKSLKERKNRVAKLRGIKKSKQGKK